MNNNVKSLCNLDPFLKEKFKFCQIDSTFALTDIYIEILLRTNDVK